MNESHMEKVFFVMICIQAGAYLWFQSKGGIVSHKNYMIVNSLLMVGQFAQAAESYTKSAMASFSIASFFFVMTAIGIFKRYKSSKKNHPPFVG